jgi:hypothetical protein
MVFGSLVLVVSHNGLAIYIKKYVKAKEELWMETQIFHHSKKIYLIFKTILQKKPKSFKILLYNSIITNLKFQHKKPKYHLSKMLI